MTCISPQLPHYPNRTASWLNNGDAFHRGKGVQIYTMASSKHAQKAHIKHKLEDLKGLKRSPDLLNNVKIDQGQIQHIMKHILLYQIFGVVAIFGQVT